MGIISSNVDEILDRVDVIDIMSAYIDLTKVNKSAYKAVCPFHDDKNPSFFVNPEKNGLWHCFGCGESGNLISFLEREQDLDFVSVMKQLSKDTGVPFSTTGISEEEKHRRYINDIFKRMQTKFEFDLNHKTAVKRIHKAILDKRKLTPEQVKEFHLGYIDTSSLNGFMDSNDIPVKDRIETGTYRINDESGEIYPTLNKRITFELRRLNGDIVGFTGEKTFEKQQPKYKIAAPRVPEQDYFYYIGDKLDRDEPVYMCEGLYDVISLKLAGITNPISTLGTQTTEKQIKELLAHHTDFVLCYDGDIPGLTAAVKIYKQLKRLDQFGDVDIKMIMIPNDMDPDDYRKSAGLDGLKELADNPLDPADFLIELFKKDPDSNKLNQTEVIKRLTQIIMEYSQDNIEQDVRLNWLSDKSKVSKDNLLEFYQQDKALKTAREPKSQQETIPQKEFVDKGTMSISPAAESTNNALDINEILGDEFKDTRSQSIPSSKISFDTVLYIREKSVLKFLLDNPAQIIHLRMNINGTLFHPLSKEIFTEMLSSYNEFVKDKSDDKRFFKDFVKSKIDSTHNVQEILFDDILRFDTNEEEFMTNLHLLNSQGADDYHNELEMERLEKSEGLQDLISIYNNLKH